MNVHHLLLQLEPMGPRAVVCMDGPDRAKCEGEQLLMDGERREVMLWELVKPGRAALK